MQHAAHLPGTRALTIALVAFVAGGAGATATYAALDGASLDLGSGKVTSAGSGSEVPRPPHAGTGGALR
jgi:hypothetical protein